MIRRRVKTDAELGGGGTGYGQVAKAFVSWIGSKGVPVRVSVKDAA